MALQQTLVIPPPAARIVSPRLAILLDEHQLVAYNGADPIYRCRRDDRDGLRLAAAMLSHLKLAPDTDLADALGINRETVRRNRKLYAEGGVEAVRTLPHGPKGPHKLTDTVQRRAQRCLDQG